MKKGKINIVIDGQWGSTGKGKIVGYLALKHQPDVAVCNFMTNAGHTFVYDDGKELFFQQIPVSAVCPSTMLVLAPTSAITLDILFKEIEMLRINDLSVKGRLFIDRYAIIIDDKHSEAEKKEIFGIASTMKGCGYAFAEKVKRRGNVRLAKDVPELEEYLVDSSVYLNHRLRMGAMILGETAQGFDLSINHGHSYPYVTSRDVTPMQFMNDCGVHSDFMGDVYGVLRTYPIRVGSVKAVEIGTENDPISTSGGCYDDQYEFTWEEISKHAGIPVQELTSVTKRIRRVFSFSAYQTEKFLRICRPNKLCINFVNYLEQDSNKVVENEDYRNMVHIISSLAIDLNLNTNLNILGTGAKNKDIIEIGK